MIKLSLTLGFTGITDLLTSLFRPNLGLILLVLSSLATFVEYTFGLKPFLFTALFILLVVELISGLLAAKLKGKKITSRKMQRFGVMLLIWFTLLMVLEAMIKQYVGKMEEHIAYYFHTTMVFYIMGIYFKSILENAESIWTNKINTKYLLAQLFKFDKKDDDESDNPS